MSSLFDITIPSNTVVLDSGRRGEASFTVTNISGRPFRARAVVVSDEPSIKPWITIEGQPERDFAIAGTQQYVVNVAVPKDAQPGNYSFRLDMAREDIPDEDYTVGSIVTFEVPESEPEQAFPPWMIFALIGVLVVVGGVIAWLLLKNGDDRDVSPTSTVGTPISTITPTPRMVGLVLDPDDELSVTYLGGGCGAQLINETFLPYYRVGAFSQEDCPPAGESITLLTFEIGDLREFVIVEAELALGGYDVIGDPFATYGNLLVEEVSYADFLSTPWQASPLTELYRLTSPPTNLDVTQALVNAINRGSSRFQVRLQFEGVEFEDIDAALSADRYFLEWELDDITLHLRHSFD
ncbi:MAG: hypothetical protein GTO18_11095 [Anaerolineales bacterium]|nr:hypothetical protein [Anaerolineales bacterium]